MNTLIIFAFSYDQETKKAAVTGNVAPEVALSMLQQIVVSLAVNKQREQQQAESQKHEG